MLTLPQFWSRPPGAADSKTVEGPAKTWQFSRLKETKELAKTDMIGLQPKISLLKETNEPANSTFTAKPAEQ